MMSRFHSLVLLALLAVGLSAAAHAQNRLVSDCGTLQGTILVTDDATDLTSLATITAEQARETALAAVEGATVTDVDLEEEDDYLVYDVDLEQADIEYDVYVDAGSGELLCVKLDD